MQSAADWMVSINANMSYKGKLGRIEMLCSPNVMCPVKAVKFKISKCPFKQAFFSPLILDWRQPQACGFVKLTSLCLLSVYPFLCEGFIAQNRIVPSLQYHCSYLQHWPHWLGCYNRGGTVCFFCPSTNHRTSSTLFKRLTHATSLWSQHYYQLFLDTYLFKSNKWLIYILNI